MNSIVQIVQLLYAANSLHLKTKGSMDGGLLVSLRNLDSSSKEVASVALQDLVHTVTRMPLSSVTAELAHEIERRSKHSRQSAPPYYAMKVKDDGFCFHSTSALYLVGCVLMANPMYAGQNLMPQYLSSVPYGSPCTQMGFETCVTQETGAQICMNARGRNHQNTCSGQTSSAQNCTLVGTPSNAPVCANFATKFDQNLPNMSAFPYSLLAGKTFTSRVSAAPSYGLPKLCAARGFHCEAKIYYAARYAFNTEGTGFSLMLSFDLPGWNAAYVNTTMNSGSTAKHQSLMDAAPSLFYADAHISHSLDDPHEFRSRVYLPNDLAPGLGYQNTNIRFNEDFTELKTFGPQGGPMTLIDPNAKSPGIQAMTVDQWFCGDKNHCEMMKWNIENGCWSRDPFDTGKEVVMSVGKVVGSGGDATGA